MIMEIILESGISSDGFKIKIENDFNHTYRYGYDASYDTKFANDSKPYVSDIIFELIFKLGKLINTKLSITSTSNIIVLYLPIVSVLTFPPYLYVE